MSFRPIFSFQYSGHRAVFSWLLALSLGVSALLLSHSAQAQEESPAAASSAATTAAEEAAPAPKPDANGYYVGGPVYVSDTNRVWTRSGPGEGYRITGNRQIGERMTFKRYSDNGRYAQLEGADGQSFWMPLDTIQPEICGAPLAEQLQGQINDLQYRLDNYDNELSKRLKDAEQQLAQVTQENSELKTSIAQKDASLQELDELYRDASSRLETKDLDMQMRWWMQGAIIALAGAIVGVILVFIPRPSRKQKRERY